LKVAVLTSRRYVLLGLISCEGETSYFSDVCLDPRTVSWCCWYNRRYYIFCYG